MSRVVIAAFAVGIWAGFVLALDPLALEVAPYYSGDDRAALNLLLEGLERP